MMRAKSFLIASVCAALFAAAGVQAAAPKPPRATQGTTVTLPVTASVEVANDQAVIELKPRPRRLNAPPKVSSSSRLCIRRPN